MSEHSPIDFTPLAAYLVTEGFELIRIDYEDDKAFFIFRNDNPSLDKAISNFRLLKAVGNVALFEQTRKELIDRVKRRSQ